MKKRISIFLLICAILAAMLPTLVYAGQPAEPQQVNGVYQIATPENLLWFQRRVSAGQTTINAVLTADIDLSTVCSAEQGNWTPIPAYGGTFDGKGHKISKLYISEATVAKQGLFAELSATGVVQNVGAENSTVSMTTTKKINNACAAILVGRNSGGIILNCYVANSSVTTYGTLNGQGAAICGSDQGGRVLNCFSRNNTITEKNNKGQISGICGYSKGHIENCYTVETTLNTTNTNAKSVCGSTVGTMSNCFYLATGTADQKATAKTKEWFMSDEAITALGNKYFAKASNGENDGYPVLTFASLSADKTKLKAELDKVPTSGYYTEDDRYNGVDTSKNGFWADMKAFVTNAQEVYKDQSAGQAEVDRETDKLKNGLQAV